MLIMHVTLTVRPEHLDAFINATIENARETRKEPGNFRYEFLQDMSDDTCFTLVEIYDSAAAMNEHLESRHFKEWQRVTAAMFTQPGTGTQFRLLYPE
jgi:(4S)-4-hydroxy-5-phosphonooxypentane-2,3-dione isomerase